MWAWPTPGTIIIQHTGTAAWARIPGAVAAHRSQVPDLTSLPAGIAVEFGLIGNPTRAVGKTRPDGSPSRNPGRRPLPLQERPAWLTRKLSGALNVHEMDGRELPPAKGHGITITRHLFTGAATVVDPHALAGLVARGIGAGKGLGCGLLLLEIPKGVITR